MSDSRQKAAVSHGSLDEEQYAWECPECGHIRVCHELVTDPSRSPRLMCCGGCTPNDGNPMNREFSKFEVVLDDDQLVTDGGTCDNETEQTQKRRLFGIPLSNWIWGFCVVIGGAAFVSWFMGVLL